MSAANTKTARRAGDRTAEAVLGYLQHRMPAYPFDAKIDGEFVQELLEDFAPQVDILEETKGFRWFYSQQPGGGPQTRSLRLSLRRWIANARHRKNGPGGVPTTGR